MAMPVVDVGEMPVRMAHFLVNVRMGIRLLRAHLLENAMPEESLVIG